MTPTDPTAVIGPSPFRGVLLIGRSGMLARAWIELLDREGIAHTDVDIPEFDLTKPASIAQHVTPAYKVVLNCAAYTDVDGCETKEPLATAINGSGVGDLAARCKEVGALLVHYSTDYVFEGNANKPYATDAPRKPIGAYGRSKAVGEERIEQSGCDYLIVRTSWLYAPWAKNFVRTIAKLASEKPMLKVVSDQRGRPTSAEHLAAATLQLLKKNTRGVYHVTDGGECSWHGFAVEIAKLAGAACKVEPCTTAEFPRPARRPAYSVLDLSKTEALVGAMPTWQNNLASVMNRLEPL